ncbi:MAG: cation:dicarboxylase symporter family transporter, partial [Erysipelotrichaceae bacterium]|nr:cation:dicarboxylase symporter family transporter [Erysipelotrichaceae bacterium]
MFKKAANFYKTYSLDPLGIDSFSEELEEELIKLNIERQNRLKIRLSLEESLLRFLDQFGTSEKFAVSINRVFGKPTIQIELEQNIFNPLSKIENDLSDWNGSLLTSAGLNPQFLYARGVNILRIVLPAQRMNPVLKIAIAIALGVGFGVLGLYCLPASTQETLGTVFFQPLYNVWNRLLLAVCGSVIFFMVITTLLDMRTVSEQGGRNRVVVGRYFGFTLIPALVAALLAQLVLMPNFEASESSEAMSTDFLDELFFHIVPANPFTPLIESNTPQILLMAYVLGTALVMLGPKAKHLSRLVQQINLVGMQLAEWISRLVPYFTAILVCYQILVGPRRLLVGVWKPLCLSLLVSIGFTFIVLLYVSKKKQVTINLLLNKLKAPFLMALKTGSLDASYGLTEQSCVAGLGIERH